MLLSCTQWPRMAPGTRVGADADRDAECPAIRRKEFGGEKTPQSGSKAPSVDIQYAVEVWWERRSDCSR